jgi:hypothetical protein
MDKTNADFFLPILWRKNRHMPDKANAR